LVPLNQSQLNSSCLLQVTTNPSNSILPTSCLYKSNCPSISFEVKLVVLTLRF
jgi:hypothetical protein